MTEPYRDDTGAVATARRDGDAVELAAREAANAAAAAELRARRKKTASKVVGGVASTFLVVALVVGIPIALLALYIVWLLLSFVPGR